MVTEAHGERPNAKLLGLMWLVAAVLVAIGIARGFSLLVALIPFRVEAQVAEKLPTPMQEAACHSGPGEAALAKLVGRIYPLEPEDAKIPLRVEAIVGREVNAFAFLAGHIYLARGLIDEAESPEEIAGVLAHEIEHVRRRHVLEGLLVRLGTWAALNLVVSTDAAPVAEIARELAGLQYGKTQEAEADEGGLRRLVRAEVDVAGFRDFFERQHHRALRIDLLSDHPSDTSRSARAAEFLGRPHRPVLEPAEWRDLRQLCR